jgi:RNA ligase (TIGR02306 family)
MYKNGERCMSWIARIEEIAIIPNADSIDAYRVGGWWVVDKKNAYNVGDLVIYISIDSWVPHELAPFLSKGSEPRLYNGVRGERLRTVKLKGQVSQGLLLKVAGCYGDTVTVSAENAIPFGEGDDVSETLGIQKWEAPVPAQLAGQVRGMFPSWIPKTDQERIQNLTQEYQEWINNPDCVWEGTEKLDGSSMTVYVRDHDAGVCSRNLDLLEDGNNSFWLVARREGLIDRIQGTGRNLALQGELIGEGIQKNPYRIRGQEFHLFDIYDIDQGRYLSSTERRALATELGIRHVPVIGEAAILRESVEQLLIRAEGRSLLNKDTEREGLVFKSLQDPSRSFKAISNTFLIKSGN